MNDLEYYKALYEQLQAQLNLIEKRFDISKFNKSKKKNGKKSTKDYDGDGEVESSKDEYFGSKDKAIKKSMSKKKKTLKEGTVISGNHFNFGGFPRILNEVSDSSDTYKDHMQNLFQYWQNMKRENHPHANKFQRALYSLNSGNLSGTNELLKLGADPDTIDGILKTGPEHHAKRKAIPQPTDISNGGRWSND
jgi:hypothetical protein